MARPRKLKYPATCAVCGCKLTKGSSGYLERHMGSKGGTLVRCPPCGPWPTELDDFNVILRSCP